MILMGRVDARLVRHGWEPGDVSLVTYLCRLTWSEWTHATGESAKVRRAEEAYQREFDVREGATVPSVEAQAAEHEANRDEQAFAKRQLATLRAAFEAAGDVVNLLWMDRALGAESGVPDVQRLAAETGRDVTEFYAAAKRRKRAVLRLLAEAGGSTWEDDA